MSGLTTMTGKGNFSKSENDLSLAVYDWEDIKLNILMKFCLKMEASELGDLSRPHYSLSAASFRTQTTTHLLISLGMLLIVFQISCLQSNPNPGF